LRRSRVKPPPERRRESPGTGAEVNIFAFFSAPDRPMLQGRNGLKPRPQRKKSVSTVEKCRGSE